MSSSSTAIERSTSAAAAAAPTMDSQQQQVRYAKDHATRGAIQLRDRDPMDFGVVAYARDPFDEQARIIRDVVNPDAGGPSADMARNLLGIAPVAADSGFVGIGGVQRVLPVSQEELDYVRRWQAQEQELMFDQWIMSQFDMTLPAERERVMKLFPRYQERQKALVDSKLALMKKWIELQMFGIRTEDDGRFLYNVYAGNIQLPQGYHTYQALVTALNPFDPNAESPEGTEGTLQARGMLNPLRYVTSGVRNQTGGFNQNNPAYPLPENGAPLAGARRGNAQARGNTGNFGAPANRVANRFGLE